MINYFSRIFRKQTNVLDFGFVTPESEGSVQKCLDSKFPSLFTKREYEVKKTLQVNNPNKIIYGNGTKLIGVKNIDILKINNGNVTANNLDIITPKNHTKSGVLFDSNYKIWRGLLNNVRVLGNKETLYKTGFGTKAFKIETDKIHRHAYTTHIKFTNCVAEWCAVGLDVGKHSDQAVKHRTWVNTLDFDFHMKGCKEYINLYSTDINKGHIIIQDWHILNESEKDLFAINILDYSRRTEITYFAYDTSDKDRHKDTGLSRHNGNIINTNGDKTIRIENIYLKKNIT